MNDTEKQSMIRMYNLAKIRPTSGAVVLAKTHDGKLHMCCVTDEVSYGRNHSSDRGYPWARADRLVFTRVDDSCYEPIWEDEVAGWIAADVLAELLITE